MIAYLETESVCVPEIPRAGRALSTNTERDGGDQESAANARFSSIQSQVEIPDDLMADRNGLKGLFPFGRGEPVAERVVLRGMKSIETEVRARLRRERESLTKRRALERKFAKGWQKSLERAGFDLSAVSADFRTYLRQVRKNYLRAIKTRPKRPKYPKVRAAYRPGSVVVTRTPPYDYEYTSIDLSWHNPHIQTATDKNNGTMSLFVDAAGETAFDVEGAVHTGLGIYIYPPEAKPGNVGVLSVSATPAFRDLVQTTSVFDLAYAETWADFVVPAFDASDNHYDGLAASQDTVLDSLAGWWPWEGGAIDRNSAVSLSVQFQVDAGRWYAVWIFFGGRIYCDPNPFPSFSDAMAGFPFPGVNVTSITWEFDEFTLL